MDKNFKTKWVEALRSGKYNKGIGNLYQDGRYCCIGVAYLLFDPAFNICVTSEAAKIIGLEPNERDVLVDMNDYQDKSFAEIADYIEQSL